MVPLTVTVLSLTSFVVLWRNARRKMSKDEREFTFCTVGPVSTECTLTWNQLRRSSLLETLCELNEENEETPEKLELPPTVQAKALDYIGDWLVHTEHTTPSDDLFSSDRLGKESLKTLRSWLSIHRMAATLLQRSNTIDPRTPISDTEIARCDPEYLLTVLRAAATMDIPMLSTMIMCLICYGMVAADENTRTKFLRLNRDDSKTRKDVIRRNPWIKSRICDHDT
jgi:hypothetical protein